MTTQNIHLSSVIHDLRNYIGGISGLANITLESLNAYLKKQESSGIKADADLKEIFECMEMLVPYSNEALHYVDDLLNSSQAQSGKFTLGELEDCDVGELVKELIVFNRALIDEHQIVIKTKIAENLPQLKTDILRLKQILINLITNAIKYSHQGNEVEIAVECLEIENQNRNRHPSESWDLVQHPEIPASAGMTAFYHSHQLQIIISDSGIGMTQEEIQMALNGDGKNIDKSALNKPIDSHGLGMSIVKQLVELLGAQIKIESEKNKGTKVMLYFPCN